MAELNYSKVDGESWSFQWHQGAQDVSVRSEVHICGGPQATGPYVQLTLLGTAVESGKAQI